MTILTDVIQAKRNHVSPLNSVQDLAWELAGRKIFHLPRPPWPAHASDSWPQADGPADELTWQHEAALFRTNLGQIVQVRQALGAWPPSSGGETW